MKIAITTTGKDLSAPLDRRFGRAVNFLIFDTDTNNFELKDNQQNYNAAQGAGIQAAQNVAETGAEAVITGHCGPKAYSVLTTAGIKIFNTDATTVQEAIDRFKSGEISQAQGADVQSHWM